MCHRPMPCLLSVFVFAACASQPPPKAQLPSEAATLPPPKVEKFREPLEVTPLELHFSGARGSTRASESVAVKNTGNDAVQVSDLRVVGPNADSFGIANTPFLPLILMPGRSFSFSVGFAPGPESEVGVHHARVRIVRGEEDDGPPCDLNGLVARGRDPGDEPPLQQILEALGYEVDVGGPSLRLPAGPLGDEIPTRFFERAKPGNVGYYLIARYGAEEEFAFGTYVIDGKKPVKREVGRVGKTRSQTINPELEGESQTSFDPGEAAFGLYIAAGKQTLYAEARANAPSQREVARVYPLRSRGRTLVQDAYVIAFDQDGDGDFQDEVFMLWNVKPAP